MPFGSTQPGRQTQKHSSACLGSPRTKSQPRDVRRKERRELRVFVGEVIINRGIMGWIGERKRKNGNGVTIFQLKYIK